MTLGYYGPGIYQVFFGERTGGGIKCRQVLSGKGRYLHCANADCYPGSFYKITNEAGYSHLIEVAKQFEDPEYMWFSDIYPIKTIDGQPVDDTGEPYKLADIFDAEEV